MSGGEGPVSGSSDPGGGDRGGDDRSGNRSGDNRGGGGDRGAQPERTRLAWRRTTLTFVVSAGLAVRRGVESGASALDLSATAVGVLALLAFLLVAHRRVTSMATMATERSVSRMSVGSAGAAALCTVTLATVGVVLAW